MGISSRQSKQRGSKESSGKASLTSIMPKGRTLTTFIAILVVNFAFLNIWISTSPNHNTGKSCDEAASTTTTKAMSEFLTSSSTTGTSSTSSSLRKQQESIPQLTDESVLSYLKEKNMVNTINALEQELKKLRGFVEGESSLGGQPPQQEPNSKSSINAETQSLAAVALSSTTSDVVADMTSTKPWSNVTTMGFYEARLYAGFRNQMMVFTIVVLEALKDNCGQILLNTIAEKDTYGSNQNIPFARLWDVPYWNSHYPQLPRLVDFDADIHDQFDPNERKWYRRPNNDWTDRNNSTTYEKPSRPKPFGKQHVLLSAYQRYGKGNGPYVAEGGHRHPAEILMLKGAMRPHPVLRQIIDEKLHSLEGGHAGADNKIDYITLHARVEPDMQKQMVCVPKKVLNLTDIFQWMEETWPNNPPAKHIFMPINREYLEQEGSDEAVAKLKKRNKADKINWIAVENLRSLNRARDEGLWNGQAKVFEFGSRALADVEYYKDRPSTTGALVNFFIGVGAKIFIGTEVSSYSHDLLATRFFRGEMDNYKYLPDGLHKWTPVSANLVDPPGFAC